MSNASFLFTDSNIVLNYNAKNYILDTSHRDAVKIRRLIKDKRYDEAAKLINIANSIKQWANGDVTVEGNQLLYKGEAIHGTLAKRIVDMYKEGFDIQPMVNFITNLKMNPSFTAVEELYLFLEAGNMPITDDGCFLAYKKVTSDYKDCYTRTIDNSIGAEPEMERNEVDDNRHNTCSRGLHFCALSYLSSYYGSSGRVVIVKINPADVVSIPSDYNNTKGRCWKYKVVAEHVCTEAEKEEYFNQSVYSADNDWEGRSEYDDEYADSEDRWWEEVIETESYDYGYSAGYEEGAKTAYEDGYDAGQRELKEQDPWLS